MKNAKLSNLALALSVCLVLFSSQPLNAQTTDFSGTWQENLSAGAPHLPPAKLKRARELKIQQAGKMLSVKVSRNTGQGVRTLDLKYEIGGPELVYTGFDGDEYHTKVNWDGDRLIFDTVEHERGKEIPSKQIWTLAEGGRILRETKQIHAGGEVKETVATFERSL